MSLASSGWIPPAVRVAAARAAIAAVVTVMVMGLRAMAVMRSAMDDIVRQMQKTYDDKGVLRCSKQGTRVNEMRVRLSNALVVRAAAVYREKRQRH